MPLFNHYPFIPRVTTITSNSLKIDFDYFLLDLNSILQSILFCVWLFLKNKFILFIYFWLCWVFVAARGLSLVVVSGG